MKRALRIENLDCASCGAKIEAEIAKLDGVNSATISFMTQRLTLDAANDKFDGIVEQARAICDRIEPGCTIA